MNPMIDALEDRRLFSFTFTDGQFHVPVPLVTTLSAGTTVKVSKTGTLFITGTGKADKLTLQVKNGKIAAGGVRVTPLSASAASFTIVSLLNSTKIKRVDVSGLGGNDVITVIADVPVSVRGAAGDDTLQVFAPTRTIEGGSGTNTIREGNEAAGDAYRTSFVIPAAAYLPYSIRAVTVDDLLGANAGTIYHPVEPTPVKRNSRGG